MYFQKITQGSFNQSHSKFGESAGKQCTCISLYAILFSQTTKCPGHWNTCDIDFIVIEGDKVYKSLDKNSYLMVTDLPDTIPMFESNVRINFLENEYGVLNGFGTVPHFLSNAYI